MGTRTPLINLFQRLYLMNASSRKRGILLKDESC